MKRVLLLLVLCLVGAVVAAERFPAIHDRVPWLPDLPFLSNRQAATAPAETGKGRPSRARRFAADGPVPVLTAEVVFADVPVTVDILGTVQATNSVLVRSQVDGKLIEIGFQEGQEVRKGDVIGRIDPVTYKAAYDQAVAKKAQDEALLTNGRVDLARYQRLAATQYGSNQQADTQKALVAQYNAQLAQDQAMIDTAKATLDYATIRAPIDGRTGIRQVDEGNIVHASDATGIVTIAQVKPVAVVFNLPQQWLRQVNAAVAKGTLKLEAHEGDSGALLDTGTLQVVDNTIDQTTGTVKLKGTFPNAGSQLWPGQFVNLRLFVDTLTHVVTVPTRAVQRGPDGPFVYVVKDDAVALTGVGLGRQGESDTIVTSGLVPPASVVTTGFNRLTDGGKISVSTPAAGGTPQQTPGGEAAPQTDTARPEGRTGRRRKAGAAEATQ